MHIEEDRTRIIFKTQNGDNTFYSVGLSKKDKDGNYINGYMSCKFPKDAVIENKTKIKILDGWVDFYVKDKITNPYIFINKYEIIEDGKIVYEKQDIPQNVKTDYDDLRSDVQLEDSDLPF